MVHFETCQQFGQQGVVGVDVEGDALCKMEARDMKINCFNGKGNVVEFVRMMELRAALKGYADERKAQNLASRLTGQAFEVNLPLSNEDQNDADRVSIELLNE